MKRSTGKAKGERRERKDLSTQHHKIEDAKKKKATCPGGVRFLSCTGAQEISSSGDLDGKEKVGQQRGGCR